MENHDTFDENGEWSLSNSDNTDGDVEKLSESNELRDALDSAIKEIGKAAKSTIKKKPNKQTKSTKPTNGSSATVHIDTSFKPQKFAPATIIAAAKPLRAVIKRLQSENQEDEITGLKAGSLNTRALYRYKNRDLSVFKERKLPTIVDAVYYICWDGSGSMCGDKQMESAYACAVIEEAVRGLYPMKIVNFSTNPGVVHYIVKDFDDKTKKNAAYSFGAQRYFSGGNKDGFSIRQCTEELIKRKETNKFLIVLSDGAPSDYSSHKEAVDDVRNAVAFARANKIDVTSIFFGSEYERDSQIGLYNEMYGASHIISCEPNEIVNHMVNIVKKNILKR
jgi:nitric oxide reductase activation protein